MGSGLTSAPPEQSRAGEQVACCSLLVGIRQLRGAVTAACRAKERREGERSERRKKIAVVEGIANLPAPGDEFELQRDEWPCLHE